MSSQHFPVSHADPAPMTSFENNSLGASPHIVVLGSCKVGNFVVSTPALHGLRSRYPDAVIGFIGSDVTADLERAHSCIDWRLSWDSPGFEAFFDMAAMLKQKRLAHGPVTLAINLDGFNPATQVLTSFLSPRFVSGMAFDSKRRGLFSWGSEQIVSLLSDKEWDSPSFLDRYSESFHSQYIAELFAVIAGVADSCDPFEINLPSVKPPFEVPDILIHCTTARSAKLWPFHHWRDVVEEIGAIGLRVGLVGSPPKVQVDSYHSGDGEDWLLSVTDLIDLRGRTSLIELCGACSEAKAVISVDAGPLHIASAMGTPTLAIVGNDVSGTGASPIRLWMPRCKNTTRTISSFTCNLCSDNKFKNDSCLVEGHPCMQNILPEQVIQWLKQII